NARTDEQGSDSHCFSLSTRHYTCRRTTELWGGPAGPRGTSSSRRADRGVAPRGYPGPGGPPHNCRTLHESANDCVLYWSALDSKDFQGGDDALRAGQKTTLLSRCGARTLACRVETLLDTLAWRRHECRRGTHECVRHID